MALNYHRLGCKRAALWVLVAGIVFTALAMGFGSMLPEGLALPIGLVLLFGTKGVAESLQGKQVRAHLRRGGRLGSKSISCFVGLGFLAATLGIIFAARNLAPNAAISRPKITFGTAGELYYSGLVTKPAAEALVDKLESLGYAGDKPTTILWTTDKEGSAISFVVRDGFWDDSDAVQSFELLGVAIASKAGGFPLRVRLLNAQEEARKELIVGKVDFGAGDNVFYLGSATQSGAEALGAKLKSLQYFGAKPATVLLARNGNATTMSFAVKDGFWENTAHVKEFEQIVRQSADSVGGLPIKLQLVDGGLQTKTDVIVK